MSIAYLLFIIHGSDYSWEEEVYEVYFNLKDERNRIIYRKAMIQSFTGEAAEK